MSAALCDSWALATLASTRRVMALSSPEVHHDDAAPWYGARRDEAKVEQELNGVPRRHPPRRAPSQNCAPLAKMPLAAFSASPVSINAPNEPAAPNARRQNWRRAEAEIELFLMSSMAMAASPSCSPSSTSRPLTIAPTGLITSWHTREQSSAARSSGVSEAIIKLVDPGFDIGTLAEIETVSPFAAFDPSLAHSLHGRDESLQMNATNEGATA